MISRIFGTFLLAFALLGSGCLSVPAPATSPLAATLSPQEDEKPVMQSRGFGQLPAVPPPVLHPETRGTIRINATLPTWPPHVSILRFKQGELNATELNRLVDALRIPAGVVGAQPVQSHLTLSWTDARGYHWTYDPSMRRFSFEREAKSISALTVAAWPAEQRIISSSLSFLDTLGIKLQKHSAPYISPDWNGWWNIERGKKRCMAAATIATVRAIAATPALLETTLPSLPEAIETQCVRPEFPSRIVVQFDLRQDGQTVIDAQGKPVHGATLYIDANSADVLGGSFTLPLDPDRSDYPAPTTADVRSQLTRGGLNGTPPGDVIISDFIVEWFHLAGDATSDATYLVPSLVGRGIITYKDGTTDRYDVVVPLIADN